MSILVVAGEPGNGKGIYSMFLIEQAVEAGRPVLTNIVLTPQCPYYDRVALIDTDEYPVYRGEPGDKDYLAFWHYTPRNAVVIIDEADLYFDCSDHSKMGKDVRKFLKQHRKLGLDIVFIVQAIPNLYVRIRRLAQRFIVCEWSWRRMAILQALAPFIGVRAAMSLSRFWRGEYGAEDLSPRSHLKDGYITYGEGQKKYFAWYTTEQLLGDNSHLVAIQAAESEGPSNDQSGSTGEATGESGVGVLGGGHVSACGSAEVETVGVSGPSRRARPWWLRGLRAVLSRLFPVPGRRPSTVAGAVA